MTHLRKLAGLFVLAAATASCGDVVRQGRGPVFLVMDLLQGSAGGATAATPTGFLLSDVITYVTTPAPCSATSPCPTIFNDSGRVTLRLSLKDIGSIAAPTAPSTNNAVTINRYHVTYRRADGRNAAGVDVPYGFDGAATGTVPVGGSLVLAFELVRHVAKMESPLVQLTDSPSVISTIADVTFYGRDQVGNEVSATGSIQIDFGNFGDR
jgi:hypothetical protein